MVSNLGKNIAEDIRESKELGIKEGIKEGKLDVAINLISLGLTIEQIVEATGLSHDEIKKLKK